MEGKRKCVYEPDRHVPLSPGLVCLPEPLVEPPRETGLPFQISFRREHLEACLLSLGCDVMARERSNFETYSMCYEHLLQHAREKLGQREQVGAQDAGAGKEEGVGMEASGLPGNENLSRWGELFLCQI